MTVTLITGGARSGKSTAALELARAWGGCVTFIATAEPLDAEMAQRIDRHRRDRPDSWELVEEPLEIDEAMALAPAAHCLLLDCLTLWTSNAMAGGLDDETIVRQARRHAEFAALRSSPVIAVTNEVGSSIVPANGMARRYRELLGRVNMAWSGAADSAFLAVAGRLLPLPRADEAAHVE
jgi:adenosylcobinamide kinase / adenosylcobinamide-phosphate guanylyltransferase